jgi:HD superfamily phosphohydrolase
MHVASHMFKNSLINSDVMIVKSFLKSAKKELEKLIVKNGLEIKLDNLDLEDKALLGFSFVLESELKSTYLILLQSLRLTGLLHDVGHLPFSHQTEYALKSLYLSLHELDEVNDEQEEFLKFYDAVTSNGKFVLHEGIGETYLDMLFNYEVFESTQKNKEVIQLYYLIVKNILNNVTTKRFTYETLHEYVASSVDADRMDYINRDLLASGYISTSADFLRLTREAILIEYNNSYKLSFMSSSLADIEHLLESRFNLYKKVFFTHNISRLDTLLETVITYLSKDYLSSPAKEKKIYQSISMMWKFTLESDIEKRLDIISQLDENWLISLFKKEYFKIKYQLSHSYQERYYLAAFEDILFGKHIFRATWKNLSEFYKLLEFIEEERYVFKEKFGKVSQKKEKRLEEYLNHFIEKYNQHSSFFAYSVVSLSIGVDKNFLLYDGENSIKLNEISTLRKRLITSRSNTVPFYLFSNQKVLTGEMKSELRKILFEVFL